MRCAIQRSPLVARRILSSYRENWASELTNKFWKDKHMDVTYRIDQKRKINGPFPGPKSQELTARRAKAVAAGVASSLPVYAAEVDGGIIVSTLR